MNQAEIVRTLLELDIHQAGKIFIGSGKHPDKIYARWEKTGNWPKPVNQLFSIIIVLYTAQCDKTKNSDGALKLILKELECDS